IIILWTLLLILNKIFYKPVGRIINEREKKSETENSEISSMKIDIEDRTAKIESVLKKARKDSIGISEEIIKKGESAREELLSTTRQKTTDDFRERMVSLDREIIEAEGNLKSEIKNFSKKIEGIFT
ncbi:MAG: hypothetical protein KAS21_06575, partial [Candidatus Aminicenantes bacterium]|nr:hypothetical protein [Candidatus Aminicenantes bacterium]